MTYFNLSEKIDKYDKSKLDFPCHIIYVEDVKEFIKRLRKIRFRNSLDENDFKDMLNKLAGEKLK